jgi:hypothetical protein
MSEQHMNIEQATESTLAKAITRFGVPLFLSAISFLGGMVLLDIRNETRENGNAQADISREVQQLTADVRVLKETVNAGLVWRITEIERRVNTVEQAQKTP